MARACAAQAWMISPAPQVSRWALSAPGRVSAAEDGDRGRGEPVALGQGPVKLGPRALPGLIGVGARSHGEHGHGHGGKLPAVAAQEPVGVTMPASVVQGGAEHHQVAITGD